MRPVVACPAATVLGPKGLRVQVYCGSCASAVRVVRLRERTKVH
jgi:ribosomal protein S26